MRMNDILSEKSKDIRETVQWGKNLQARREKADLLTKELSKKYTPELMRQLTMKSISR